MIVEINEEQLFRIRGPTILLFLEELETTKLFLPTNNVIFTATHEREDFLPIDEGEGPNMYLVWKDEHLKDAIPILSYKEGGSFSVTVKEE